MGQVVHAPAVHTTDWTTVQACEQLARSRGKPAVLARGSWLSDLAVLRKSVTLCFKCVARWSPKANGYQQGQVLPGWNHCRAECDGCATETHCTFFNPVEG